MVRLVTLSTIYNNSFQDRLVRIATHFKTPVLYSHLDPRMFFRQPTRTVILCTLYACAFALYTTKFHTAYIHAIQACELFYHGAHVYPYISCINRNLLLVESVDVLKGE